MGHIVRASQSYAVAWYVCVQYIAVLVVGGVAELSIEMERYRSAQAGVENEMLRRV